MSEEKVVAFTDPMRCWRSYCVKSTKVGSFVGRVLLTDQRLLFLSTGGANWVESAGHLALGGIPGVALGLATAGYPALDLDLSGLRNDGSFEVPLPSVLRYEPRRSGLIWYLSLACRTNGTITSYSLTRESLRKRTAVAQLAVNIALSKTGTTNQHLAAPSAPAS